MVLIQCPGPCGNATGGALRRDLVEELQSLVERFGREHPGAVLHVQSFYTYSDLHPNPMLSRDGQSMLFQWTWRVRDELKWEAEALCKQMRILIREANARQVVGGGVDLLAATGPTFIKSAMRAVLAAELPQHELFSLPLALMVLAWRLQSARMMVFPLLALAIAVPISFAAIYFLSLRVVVLSHVPMMMALLCSALSLDYSLFMLLRYAEERRDGAAVREAVHAMIASSGRVVLLSGVVLVVAYAAMLFLPCTARSFAVSAGCAILTCIGVQLTFVPALMAVCPWLGPAAGTCLPPDELDEHAEEGGQGTEEEEEDEEKDGADIEGTGRDSPHHDRSCWFRLGGWLTRFPANVVVPVVVYAAMAPLTLRALHFRPGHGFELTVPRRSEEWATALRIQQSFAGDAGCFFPVLLLAAQDGDGSVLRAGEEAALDVRHERFFEANCRMADTLINATRGKPYALRPEDFQSVTFYGHTVGGGVRCFNYSMIDALRHSAFMGHLGQVKLLKGLWDELVSERHDAMLTVLHPSIDAFSGSAFALVRDIRRTLAEGSQHSPEGWRFLTFSGTGIVMDNIETMTQALPRAFVTCVLISFAVIAISFGAALVPVKLLFTVGLPITWSYGAALHVYEDGALAWTHIEGLMPVGDQGLIWIAPMFTLTITLGLALDYEIFLFTRVLEYRQAGCGEREAIVLGLSATGPVITSAGLIFAITFSSMLLASIPLVNHMGFLLAFAVLVDTFIVRTVLVPAMLSLCPALNYWPTKMPQPIHTWY